MRDSVDVFDASVRTGADDPFLIYFDGVLTFGDVDKAADVLAAALHRRGVRRG